MTESRADERDEILKQHRAQFIEIMKPFEFSYDAAPHVTCVCVKTVPIVYSYRCLYCGIWFCKACAKHHFGDSND